MFPAPVREALRPLRALAPYHDVFWPARLAGQQKTHAYLASIEHDQADLFPNP